MTERNDTERTRDDFIELVRFGNVKPQEAEAHAASHGWAPFAHEPPMPAFDPMRMSWWSIVMAIAWIAWRDIKLVREQQPEFRAQCTHWSYRHWREPTDNGTAFKHRAGWHLESYKPSTAARLLMTEAILDGRVPLSTKRMSVREAEAALWLALADGALMAVGLDRDGKPTDIPQREWSYLKLFEERDRDVLKYDALDRLEVFSKINLKRDELLSLWPRLSSRVKADEKQTWPIEPYMLALISAADGSGFIPLCAAIQWIMTEGGKRVAMMDDVVCWKECVRKLWPGICGDEIELIGLQAGHSMTTRIPGHLLTLIKVLPPLQDSLEDILLTAPSHIACTPYIDHDHWNRDFNDRLYEAGKPGAAWSHLQVRKSQILQRWPKAVSIASVEHACYQWLFQMMQEAPTERPRSRNAFLAEAKIKFLGLAERQFIRVWQRAIADSGAKWSKSGRPKSNRGGN